MFDPFDPLCLIRLPLLPHLLQSERVGDGFYVVFHGVF